jgi:hypothetical protein
MAAGNLGQLRGGSRRGERFVVLQSFAIGFLNDKLVFLKFSASLFEDSVERLELTAG